MVTGGKQKVTVVEAIKVWTLDGAYATFEEKIKGSITPGKLADFVVLQRDPHKVAPDTIKEFAVEATYLVGPEDLFCARPRHGDLSATACVFRRRRRGVE